MVSALCMTHSTIGEISQDGCETYMQTLVRVSVGRTFEEEKQYGQGHQLLDDVTGT